jgi:Calcineurin-like phosphoesterase
MERTIVIGDIHGCADELGQLIEKAGWRPGERLVMVGDLVAKGPDSQAVVARARESGALAVMGNHDAHVLHLRQVALGRVPGDGRKAKPEHQQVLDTLTDPDWAYLEHLPLLRRLGPEHPGDPDTAVVHAGLVPGIPLEQQSREHLLTLRSITNEGEPTKKAKGMPWGSQWRGPERIVFGHDAVRGLQEYAYATGLDTGCVYGGQLTALVLPERKLVAVRARRAYVSV